MTRTVSNNSSSTFTQTWLVSTTHNNFSFVSDIFAVKNKIELLSHVEINIDSSSLEYLLYQMESFKGEKSASEIFTCCKWYFWCVCMCVWYIWAVCFVYIYVCTHI